MAKLKMPTTMAGFVGPSLFSAMPYPRSVSTAFRGLTLPYRSNGLALRVSRTSSPSFVSMVTTEKKKAGKKDSQAKGKSGKRVKKSSSSPGLLRALEKYEPVIGIEFHVQLSTKTKAYCNCHTKATRTPNINVCPICMGHPGALPVVNSKVVELAAKAGMALGCQISRFSRYDRKNYYYVDTAKNYQITQDLYPIALNGSIELPNSGRVIGVTRLHMEEDSAKMSHEGGDASGRLTDSTHSLVDFNRSGVPLIEIVSEPDIRSGVEAAEYGQEIQRILRYVGTSDCNMQDGSMRCDVNISLRVKGTDEFGTKIELKNLNSFSAAHKSIDFEIERQAEILDSGGKLQMETRTWDEKANETRTMRVKEGAADYRYFPEPDIPHLQLSDSQLQIWKDALPELPSEKRAKYQTQYGLSGYDSFLLSEDTHVAKYFEDSIAAGANAKQAANWIMGDITKVLKSEKMDIKLCKLSAKSLAKMARLIDSGVISNKIAKDLVPELVTTGGNPAEIIEQRFVINYPTSKVFSSASISFLTSFFLVIYAMLRRDLKLISDPDVIRKIIEGVVDANPKELESYKQVSDISRYAIAQGQEFRYIIIILTQAHIINVL